jgi:uncharacterized membrane protein YtjA (UPF0391 family)
MFVYSILSLFVAVVAGILGLTVFAGVAVAAAQLILVAAWIAFMIFTLMGGRDPAPAANLPVRRPSGLHAD